MKIQELFDLLAASQDFLGIFEGVESPSQLVSRFERLKREDADGILQDLNALRIATVSALEANLELGGSLGNTDEDEPSDLEAALSGFPEFASEDDERETGNPPNEPSTNPPPTTKKENPSS